LLTEFSRLIYILAVQAGQSEPDPNIFREVSVERSGASLGACSLKKETSSNLDGGKHFHSPPRLLTYKRACRFDIPAIK
jgi:hypothetical protein